jgi:hypothetical protein
VTEAGVSAQRAQVAVGKIVGPDAVAHRAHLAKLRRLRPVRHASLRDAGDQLVLRVEPVFLAPRDQRGHHEDGGHPVPASHLAIS